MSMDSKDLNYYMNLPYKIEILPEEDGTAYTATIPDLRGCIAFGETPEEALQMIDEAKELWVETALDKGWPIPEPKKKIRVYKGGNEMSKVEPIWKDEREIDGIWEVGVDEATAVTYYVGYGEQKVTKIVCYLENGLNPEGIPWFAVYVGDEISARVPAHGFGVVYKRSET